MQNFSASPTSGPQVILENSAKKTINGVR